ncbi:MAG: AsmA family protein [Bacteroidetes bacterium]|nr:AsmA family protein [Bacteroidota bacterium]
MKKFLIIIATILGFIVLVLAVIPVFFKDDIKAKIDEELSKTLDATVVFDADNFHITFFRNFPNITIGLEDFGIINHAPFEGEVLFAVKNLGIEINVKRILIDGEISIEGIYLEEPIINLLVEKDGKANWDIYIDYGEEAPEEEATGEEEMSFGIERWEIINGNFVYSDASIPFTMEMRGMNHTGSGDFTLTVFDLDTHTTIDTLNVEFDGTSYLKNKKVSLDAVLNMDLDAFKFTFKENEARINDFKLGFDGWFAMPDEGFDMDISFEAKDNSFKSLLSLIPGVYMEEFEDLKTSGSLSFGGKLKGTYNEEQMPAFTINLNVRDGMFQYPDLPTAISNVNMDMLIDNRDGNIDNTLIDISKFHIEFGNNPFDATLKIANLVNYPVELRVTGKLDLGEIMTMFPMEGMELRGKMGMDISVNGIYDSVASVIPKINASFSLTDGYASSSEAPVPLENIQMDLKIINSTGKLKDTRIIVESFKMKLQDEEITASLLLENLDDYTWDVRVTGSVDLQKLMPVINAYYPMPGTNLEGVISTTLSSKGKMSDLEAERYANLLTSGELNIRNFKYTDEELLPQGFAITNASMKFNPKEIVLERFEGSIGRSDMKLTGSLQNYIAYIFSNETIKGNLNFSSTLLDLNEWMTEEESDLSEEDTLALEVFPVPENIDFTLTSRIDKILYDNITLKDASGEIVVRNGEVRMNNLRFNTLGGTIIMNGTYHTHDIEHPFFDYNLGIKNLSISESYATFNTVQKMAPIAKNITGNYSTEFKIKGNLMSDMMPDYATLAGGGLIKIVQATMSGSKIMQGINALTNQANSDKVDLSDIIMEGEIKEGRFYIKPFNVKLGNYETIVSGSNGLDGSLDFKLKFDIPAGELGQQLNQTIASFTGRQADASSTVKLTIGLGGTYDDPKPKLLAADTGEGLKEQVAENVKQELIKTIQDKTGTQVEVADIPDTKELKEEVKQELDTTKAEVKDIAKTQTDSLVQGLLKGDSVKVEKAIEDAQDKIKNLFNRKKKKKNQ